MAKLKTTNRQFAFVDKMLFLNLEDKWFGGQHTYLIVPIESKELKTLKNLFSETAPSLTFSAFLLFGHPCIGINYNQYAVRIPLDEVFASGKMLGDNLKIGDVTTLILTDKPQNEVITLPTKEIFNFELENIIAYVFTCTKEMQEVFQLYSFYKRLRTNLE
jgi:hypothetical protein